jgi:SAM-dependent methyltransferase
VDEREDFWKRPAGSRVWDHLAGGKNNFGIDRAVADELARKFPDLVAASHASRLFVARAVHLLATEGIDQFLDIGCAFPTWGNDTHEVAQKVNSRARVVYVDNDVLVAAHARALLTSITDEGRSEFLQADLREPDTILTSPIVCDTLDLTRPVALVLSGVLHDLPDTDQPHRLVGHLVRVLAPGSHVVLSHLTADWLLQGDDAGEHLTKLAAAAGYGPLCPRSRAEIARFLDGLDLLKPGLAPAEQWEPGPSRVREPSTAMCYAAVGRVP